MAKNKSPPLSPEERVDYICGCVESLHKLKLHDLADNYYQRLIYELSKHYSKLSKQTILRIEDIEKRFGPDYVLPSPRTLSDIVPVHESHQWGKDWKHYIFGGTLEDLRKADFPHRNIKGINILLVNPGANYKDGDVVERLPHNTFHCCNPHSLKELMEVSPIN